MIFELPHNWDVFPITTTKHKSVHFHEELMQFEELCKYNCLRVNSKALS